MSRQVSVPGGEDAHPLLTIEEAARLLRIGRSLVYELARVYLDSDGREGLPVIRFGSCLRVRRWALVELMTTGNVVCLGPGASLTPKVSVGR